jgi:hypothetical protein
MLKASPLLLGVFVFVSYGQSPETLTNQMIYKMAQAGVPSSVIIQTIAAAPRVDFHFLPGDLQDFQSYKVPEGIFEAMAAKAEGLLTPTVQARSPTSPAQSTAPLAVFSRQDGAPPNPASSVAQAQTSTAFIKHGREYKPARVLDSSMSQASYVTGAVTNGYASGTTSSTTNGTFNSLATGPIQSGSLQATSTGTINARSSSTTSLQYVTVQTNELLLVGDKYFYVIADSTQKGNTLLAYAVTNRVVNRKHGCRFIVGEETMYSQEKGKLHIIDVDGRECNVPIIRQQRR